MKYYKLNIWTFILFYIRINVGPALFNISYTILNAFMPALETILLANFINSACVFLEGQNKDFTVILYMCSLLIVIFVTDFMPEIAELINLKAKNKITVYLKKF